MLSPEVQTAIFRSLQRYQPNVLEPHDLFKLSPPDVRASTVLTGLFTGIEMPLNEMRIASTGLSPASEQMDPLSAVFGNGSSIASLFSHLSEVQAHHAANKLLAPSQDITVHILEGAQDSGATFALTITTDGTMMNAYQETQLVPFGSVGFVLNLTYPRFSPGNDGMRTLLTVMDRSIRHSGAHARFAIIEPQDRTVHLAASFGDIVTNPHATSRPTALHHAARMVDYYNPDLRGANAELPSEPMPVYVWTHGSELPISYVPEAVKPTQTASKDPSWINGVMTHIERIQGKLSSKAMTTMTVSFIA